jgi:hypothetical protein
VAGPRNPGLGGSVGSAWHGSSSDRWMACRARACDSKQIPAAANIQATFETAGGRQLVGPILLSAVSAPNPLTIISERWSPSCRPYR